MTASVYATGRHSSFRTMDLSTQMIRKIFAEKEREILEDNREDNIKYIDNLWKNILESEENIISSSPEGKKYFPKENIKRMRISLRSSQQEQIKELDWTGQGKLKWKILLPFMNTEKLSDEVDKNYYNINVMKVVSNIVTKLNSAPVDPYELLPSEKFNTWLTHLQRMGAESVFGVAMKASLGEEPNTDLKPSQLPLDNLFVIKAPRKKSSDDTLLHEMFIGIFGTNKLREFLPNIAYIYGGFKCSPPYFDADSKDVLNFCSNDDEKVQVNYIVYENVARNEAKSLGKFVQTCTAQEYLEVILQIAFTLRKAHELCNFTHYDLHDENVIIRSMPKKIALTYETELGINQYLHTDYIATIIDLGSAHIRYQGVNFGYIHTGLATRGVSPNRSFVLFDIYKILCFSLYSMGSSQTGGATFNVMKSLLTFFNQTDTPEQLLINQREFYYSLPYTREIQNGSVTLDDFIKFI